jgi:hypothetical protein
MAYTSKPHEVAYYREREWVETPSQMLHPLLVRTLENTHSFSAVLVPPYAGRYTHALRTQILELIQDFTSQPPTVVLSLRVRLTACIANAPQEPRRGQDQRQDTQLFVIQNEPDLPGIETNIRQADHVQAQQYECDQQERHEPMEQHGHCPIALHGILELCHRLCAARAVIISAFVSRIGPRP